MATMQSSFPELVDYVRKQYGMSPDDARNLVENYARTQTPGRYNTLMAMVQDPKFQALIKKFQGDQKSRISKGMPWLPDQKSAPSSFMHPFANTKLPEIKTADKGSEADLIKAAQTLVQEGSAQPQMQTYEAYPQLPAMPRTVGGRTGAASRRRSDGYSDPGLLKGTRIGNWLREGVIPGTKPLQSAPKTSAPLPQAASAPVTPQETKNLHSGDWQLGGSDEARAMMLREGRLNDPNSQINMLAQQWYDPPGQDAATGPAPGGGGGTPGAPNPLDALTAAAQKLMGIQDANAKARLDVYNNPDFAPVEARSQLDATQKHRAETDPYPEITPAQRLTPLNQMYSGFLNDGKDWRGYRGIGQGLQAFSDQNTKIADAIHENAIDARADKMKWDEKERLAMGADDVNKNAYRAAMQVLGINKANAGNDPASANTWYDLQKNLSKDELERARIDATLKSKSGGDPRINALTTLIPQRMQEAQTMLDADLQAAGDDEKLVAEAHENHRRRMMENDAFFLSLLTGAPPQ